ncbi:MAG: DUF1570 domain-containing protein [Phycisphaerales bacterium]|nr:DUF1570 domain-containing protein [Phycisphaerales bacterium]
MHHMASKRAKRSWFAIWFAAILWPALPAAAQMGLKSYDSKYYQILTDLDADKAREAKLRVTLMFEEYARRTRGFAGNGINGKLPFMLFRNIEDYIAAGGPPGTAGVFNGQRLMAVADPRFGDRVWSTVQHEGFHQFVMGAVGGDIPIWANEGLAEYFAEGQFTGDDFITGLIPKERLKRVKSRFEKSEFKSLRDMMMLQHETWNSEGSIVNYDQAWSMIHFLAHANEGKYQKPFNGFLRAVSGGDKWETAWERSFGRGVREFQQRWSDYWRNLADDPTASEYDRVAFSTLASFFARAASQRQYFDSPDDFFEAAGAGKLKHHAEDWLPPAILKTALERADQMGEWSIAKGSGGRKLILLRPDKQRYTGSFQITGSRVKDVNVKVDRAAAK